MDMHPNYELLTNSRKKITSSQEKYTQALVDVSSLHAKIFYLFFFKIHAIFGCKSGTHLEGKIIIMEFQN